MGWGLAVIVPFGIIIGIIVLTWATKQNKKIAKIRVTPNAKFIINPFRKEFTDGYGLGRLERQRENKNGTTLIEFYPIDRKEGDFSEKPELQKVVVLTNDIISTTFFSDRRDALFLNSRNMAKMPEELRETTLSQWSTAKGQEAFLIRVFGKGTIQAGDDAIASAMDKFARGGVQRNILDQITEENRIRRQIDELKDKK